MIKRIAIVVLFPVYMIPMMLFFVLLFILFFVLWIFIYILRGGTQDQMMDFMMIPFNWLSDLLDRLTRN